jgi:hypothetical protein
MSSGSSMLAMILRLPPQHRHVSISMPNTRFSRCAQLIATCRGGGGWADPRASRQRAGAYQAMAARQRTGPAKPSCSVRNA